jgi:hypothetical protein
MMSNPARALRQPPFVAVALSACLALGCQPGLEELAGDGQPQAAAPSPEVVSALTQPLTITFEVPPEYDHKTRDGAPLVVGFRVGYFNPEVASPPIASIDLRRDAVIVEGKIARATLPPHQLPPGTQRVVLRVQALTVGMPGAWSAPTGVMNVPPELVEARAPRPSRPPPRRLAPADLDGYHALKQALDEALPRETAPENFLDSFRRVEDLATAIVLSQQQKVPLLELHRAMQGPPRRSLGAALRVLKPSQNQRRAIQEARTSARRLLVRAPAPFER